MKYITFMVPCYNSEAYMKKCVDSLLIGKDDIEIIIVDDGSTDKTALIADKYKEKYPNIIKVIHQKNGGHGECINVALKKAKGKYFKVVDSDDWLDKNAYKYLLKEIKNIDTDVIFTNYVYTYNDREDNVVDYKNVFSPNKILSWSDMGRWKLTQYPFLHSMIFKKSVLDKSNINLPKHTFYEDNMFIYTPLINIDTIYYMDINLYMYYIGRPDQSVQDIQLIKHSDSQVRVSSLVCSMYDLEQVRNKKLRKLMFRECVLLMTLGVIFSRLSYSDEGEKQYKELWKNVKNNNPSLVRKMKFSMAWWSSLPGKFGRMLSIKGYKLAHKLIKFN